MISPFCSSAIEIAKCGRPCRKLVVPSKGSTIQRWSGSVPGISPLSSMRKPKVGRALASSSRKVRSDFRSALVTKSPGPFIETWSCETSPKSRFNERAALSAALAITLMTAERVAIDQLSKKESVFGAFDVGGVGRVHHDAGAGADMRWHHHAHAVLELGRLVGGRSSLALHDGIGFDDFHDDGLGQADRDRRTLIARDGDHHAFLQEHRRLADQIGVQRDLLEGLLLHEGVVVAVREQELVVVLVQPHALDRLGGAEALVELGPV